LEFSQLSHSILIAKSIGARFREVHVRLKTIREVASEVQRTLGALADPVTIFAELVLAPSPRITIRDGGGARRQNHPARVQFDLNDQPRVLGNIGSYVMWTLPPDTATHQAKLRPRGAFRANCRADDLLLA